MKRLCDWLPAMNLKAVRSRESHFVSSGTIWPTGEWSLGYRRLRPDDGEWFGHLADTPGGFGDDRTGPGADVPRPLNLSNLPNSHKPSSRPETYGRKGITGYGKKMVRSFGAVIDRDFPRHRVTFATVTMPTVSRPLRAAMAECWPEFVRQVLQWLKRRLAAAGVPPLVVSVTEIQPKRLSGRGEGYLHLHLLWLNAPAKAGRWSVPVVKMKEWAETFLARRGLLPDGGWVNVNVKRVSRGAAAYLSKYASKGGGLIAEFAADCGWAAVPGQWWNLTAEARAAVKASVLKGQNVGMVLDALLSYWWENSNLPLYRYVYQVELTIDGRGVNVGWRGCFSEWGLTQAADAL